MGDDDDFKRAYVYFDERQDVLASLDLLKLLAPLVHECPWYWKWVIVGAENALQGAMVCALVDSTGTSVLAKKSRIEMLNWLDDRSEARGKEPKRRLAPFNELLKACVSQLELKLTPEQHRDIDRLHQYFRNNFAHFTPKGWGIERAGLPRIVGAALSAVEQLMGSQRMGVHLEEGDQRRLKRALAGTRASLGL